MADTTITIQETVIGTPDSGDGGLNLCTGAALFPPFPTIPLGWQTANAGALNVSKSHSALIAKASASAAVGIAAGLCGPSYALRHKIEGDVVGDQIHLTVSDDEAMGGIFLALGMQVHIELNAEVYKIYWHWGPHGHWVSKLDVKLEAGIDILKAAIDIIAAVLQVENLIVKSVTEEVVDTPLAMVGENSDVYALKDGLIELHCVFSVPVNLWVIIVAAATVTEEIPYVDIASSVVLAIDEVLDVTLSSIGFGFTIGVDCPVALTLDKVTVDDVEFSHVDGSDGAWNGKRGTGGTISDPPKNISCTWNHTAGFDIQVGVYAELQVMELFHVGGSAATDILGLFNIQPTTSPFTHTFSNTVGAATTSFSCGCPPLPQGMGMVDVDFL